MNIISDAATYMSNTKGKIINCWTFMTTENALCQLKLYSLTPKSTIYEALLTVDNYFREHG